MAAVVGEKFSVSDYNRRLGNRLMNTVGANDNSVKESLADDCQLMPGIQLDSVRSFCGLPEGDIHVTPIIVDFRSLLLSKTGVEIVKGVSYLCISIY